MCSSPRWAQTTIPWGVFREAAGGDYMWTDPLAEAAGGEAERGTGWLNP